MDWYDYDFAGMHLLWWTFWIVLFVPLFWFVVPVRRSTVRLLREDPFCILQRRYAAGEISTEEYEERKMRIDRDSYDPTLRLSRGPLDRDGHRDDNQPQETS